MIRPSFARLLRTLVSPVSIEQPLPLGRWKVKHDEQAIETTVKWSNEDHCGVCSQEFKYQESTKQSTPTSYPNSEKQKITMDNCCGNGCPNCQAYIEFVCSAN